MRRTVAQPKTIEFYRCLRPVQDRFVAATQRVAPPAPLLFHRAGRPTAWVLLAASAGLVVVATIVLVRGWGSISSPLALHRTTMLCVDVILFSAAAYCLVHATVILRAMEALPYRAGTYLFPACVVDASGSALRVWSVADVADVERQASPPALALRMGDGARVLVAGATSDEVERAAAALTSRRQELSRALAEDDFDMLAELDPLHETRVSSPITSKASMTPFSPLWMRFDWLIALCIGLPLGLGLGSMRNASSDERMYRTVAAAGSVPMYQKYLARGGRHSDEVRDVLLARAELLVAERQGTVEALEEFARTHPDSKIQNEVDAAMHRALLAELDKAKAAGTTAALDDFIHKYPDHRVDPELKAARHALYERALVAWQNRTHVDAATGAFIERLLASAEQHGPTCEVRFRFKPDRSIADVDRRITKHAYYRGPETLPSHYLTAAGMRAREQSVGQAVVDGFAAAFPADILAVQVGEPLAPDAAPPAGKLALVVDYTADWPGAMTASGKPHAIFAGIRFVFDGRFLLPEGAPMLLSLKSLRAPELWKTKGAVTLEDFYRKVYDAMIDRAFDDWRKKLAEVLFR